MEHIIFLCHRIPYPPNKGDKIRSFNLLKALAEKYHVHLGCFVDDPTDWAYQQKLESICTSVHCEKLTSFKAYGMGATALLRGLPITVPFYANRKFQSWVFDTISENAIERGLVFSSSVAQFLDHPQLSSMRRVIDFVDVDSNKWAQYADKKSGIARLIYRREHQTLHDYENYIAGTFDHSLLVSTDEAELFKRQLPLELRSKVSALSNGVDTVFFDPAATFEPESLGSSPFISFTGAMDYWANVDAVTWFSQHVWPTIHEQHPDLRFLIVGGKPTNAVLQLTQIAGIEVTGRVSDIRPYIAEAELVVAPMRIARGIQNKVLEALAMDKAVVATSMAMEGIDSAQHLNVCIEDEPNNYAQACLELLRRTSERTPLVNRQWVLDHFSWKSTLAGLPAIIEGTAE